MRKLWFFSLLGMFSLSATVAEAKVCFLPNVIIGGKCVALSKAKYNDCKGFTETVNCEIVGKEIIDTCTANGQTYYKCGCRGDVISWDVIKEHPGWLCETGYDDGCGCSAEHIICSSEYKYRGDGTGKCVKSEVNNNSRGVGACALPNGHVYYRDCNCNGYPYECDGLTGLKAPTGVNDSSVGCLSPHSSNYKYKECECADGWTSGSCDNNKNGCLMPISYVTANDGELVCALCDERICKSSGESNLEAIYCEKKGSSYADREYLSTTTTNCIDLGFVQGATGGFCPAGTKKAGEAGVKCPFDGNYMFCEDQSGCHPTKEACESSGRPGSVLECVDTGGCYRVSQCTIGYELDENTGACVVAECPEGFTTTELMCEDETEYGLLHGYSGDVVESGTSGALGCKQCLCDVQAAREAGYCKYTNNPDDTENSIAAGEGILSVPCCDGSYSECQFAKGTTERSIGVARHEIHKACGQTYYVATECIEGYELVNGKCKATSCPENYSTEVQSVADCSDSGRYKGALGWSLSTTKVNGSTAQSGGKTCYQCTCNEPNCKWNISNKGPFGILPETTACCKGSYKTCLVNKCQNSDSDDLSLDNDPSNDCVPALASVELCNSKPDHAKSLKQYTACGQTRCLVNECNKGYKPSDDRLSCVFDGKCDPALGLTEDTDGSCTCDNNNNWYSDARDACIKVGLTFVDNNTCSKDGLLYSIDHKSSNNISCSKANLAPNNTCQNGYVSDGNGGCVKMTCFEHCESMYPGNANYGLLYGCKQDCCGSGGYFSGGDKCTCYESQGYYEDPSSGNCVKMTCFEHCESTYPGIANYGLLYGCKQGCCGSHAHFESGDKCVCDGYYYEDTNGNCKSCEDFGYISESNRDTSTYTYSSEDVMIGSHNVTCYEITGCEDPNKILNDDEECVTYLVNVEFVVNGNCCYGASVYDKYGAPISPIENNKFKLVSGETYTFYFGSGSGCNFTSDQFSVTGDGVTISAKNSHGANIIPSDSGGKVTVSINRCY